MSHHPPPPYAGPPPKYRPRARWFVVGGVLLVLAPVVLVAALFTVLAPLFSEDAVFPADGSQHSVSLPAGEERAVFTGQGALVRCAALDGSGEQVDLRSVGGSFTVNDWEAVARFDTGDGDLTFACEGSGTNGDVRIGAIPSMGSFAGGLVIGIVGPLLLGGAGLTILVVTGILWATRQPRPREGTVSG